MLVLFGKSASGKDTLADTLCMHYNFYRRVEVTTRPMRPTESQGNPYVFVNEETFKNMRILSMLIAHKSFVHIINGKKKRVYYGIMKSALELMNDQDCLITTNIEMAEQLKKKIKGTSFEKTTRFVEVTCLDEIRYARLEKRGTAQQEILRRAKDEYAVYQHSEKLRDFVVDNTYNDPIVSAEQIFKFYINS